KKQSVSCEATLTATELSKSHSPATGQESVHMGCSDSRPAANAKRKARSCGDDRGRTGNLRLAKPALSQLSYVPAPLSEDFAFLIRGAVGVLGFEPRTSALSELRSSQLSYTPLAPPPGSQRLWAGVRGNKKAKPRRVWLIPASSFRIERQPSSPPIIRQISILALPQI